MKGSREGVPGPGGEQRPSKYAWFVLFMIFMTRVMHQLHKMLIGYAFGFIGLEDKMTDKYMISLAHPQLIANFGVVSSLLFSITYSTFGVYAGVLSSKLNRSAMLGLACICWSLTSIGSGLAPSFTVFCLLRVALGLFCSVGYPAGYGLIADYFPPSYRSTANALESSGSYVGAAVASLSILAIK